MKQVFETGDWVEINGKPEQICAVHERRVSYRVGGDKTSHPIWVFNNAVKPIPIKAEVFSNNGFKCTGVHEVKMNDIGVIGVVKERFIYKDDDCYVTVTPIGDSWNVTHVLYDASQPTNSATVRNVHELQHAFGLFGVDIKIRM